METPGLALGGTARSMASGHGQGQGGRVAFTTLLQSWVSRKFAVGCAILFPVAVTVWVTWWFLQFFDSIFSPIYYSLFGLHVFGLGFVTSMVFILGTGVFISSWVGNTLLGIGEVVIQWMPIIKHIYSASKQVSAALNPESESTNAFQECCLIRHPRHGEYAVAFVTGKTTLQVGQTDVNLLSVYVPTNHVYIGDIFMMEEKDIIHTNLSVREGLELVVSVGMGLPETILATKVTKHLVEALQRDTGQGR
ncbi:hypothetical protein FOA52_014902 [Chlamydomonas sp. UWO 241]|nr:hypothetical protein FOA52_014902 [Chlamydomonas sp. UWO 241]